jgi:glycosyltransferase involved in cell wall biosynthesis
VKVALHIGQLSQRTPGGIGRYVRELLAALPSAGVDAVPFAAGAVPDPPARFVDLGWPHGAVRYELWHRLRLPPLPGRLVDGVDVVHAPSLAIVPRGSRPLVVTVHDLAFEKVPEAFTARGLAFHRRGLVRARAHADAVVTPSRATADALGERGFDPERVHVAHHGARTPPPSHKAAEAACRASLGLDRPYVLAVGTVEPRKGLDVTAAAVRILRGRGVDLDLAVVGPPGWGTVPELDAPWIHRLGTVDEVVLAALYRGAMALAQSSRWEGFGLPVLEAMAHGCPVVAANSSSLPEIVGPAAPLVPVGEPEALAEELGRLASDGTARHALVVSGLARAATFTWPASAAAHRRAYDAAVAFSQARRAR